MKNFQLPCFFTTIFSGGLEDLKNFLFNYSHFHFAHLSFI